MKLAEGLLLRKQIIEKLKQSGKPENAKDKKELEETQTELRKLNAAIQKIGWEVDIDYKEK